MWTLHILTVHPLHCATYVRWWYEFVASFTDLSHLYYLIASTVLICRVDSKQSWALTVMSVQGLEDLNVHNTVLIQLTVQYTWDWLVQNSRTLPTFCLLGVTYHHHRWWDLLGYPPCICVLKAIKYWKWGRPENETKELVHIATSYISYMCVSSICLCSVGNDEYALYSEVCW